MTSLRATASSSDSGPLSKGQHTSIMVTWVLSSITMSGRTGEPLSLTVLSVEREPVRTALERRSTILLWRVVMAGMLVGQWQSICGSVSSSSQWRQEGEQSDQRLLTELVGRQFKRARWMKRQSLNRILRPVKCQLEPLANLSEESARGTFP